MADNTNVQNTAMDDALDDLARALHMLSLAEDALERPDDRSLQAARWLIENAGYVLDLEMKTDLAHV